MKSDLAITADQFVSYQNAHSLAEPFQSGYKVYHSTSDSELFVIPCIRTNKYGGRAFEFAAPSLYNSLPIFLDFPPPCPYSNLISRPTCFKLPALNTASLVHPTQAPTPCSWHSHEGQGMPLARLALWPVGGGPVGLEISKT